MTASMNRIPVIENSIKILHNKIIRLSPVSATNHFHHPRLANAC
jgi:hypothetical protein